VTCDRGAAVRAAPVLDCLLQAGLVTEADPILAVRLEKLGDGKARLTLLRVNVAGAAVDRSVVRSGPLDDKLVSSSLALLFGQGDTKGALGVNATPAGARVLVDGTEATSSSPCSRRRRPLLPRPRPWPP
jgi:hypothetical protein